MRKFIGDKKFYRMLFAVALPIMIQNGISNFVGLLDNIMIGRLGTEPMSGVAIVNQLLFIYWLCMFGGLSGVGIYTAQYYGNKDEDGIKNTIRYKIWLGIVISIATALIFIFFGEVLIKQYLNGDSNGGNLEAALKYGKQYLIIILFMLPATFVSMIYTSTMRECSETIIPMISGGIGVGVNLVLNYILIYGKL